MEREDQVIESLGEQNFNLLMREVTTGRLTKPTIKKIALGMGGTVHGAFVESEQDSPTDVMLKILDRWNEEGNDSVSKLIEILNHRSIGKNALAREITLRNPVSSEVKGNSGNKANQGCSVEKAIDIILQAVREGKIVKPQAEDFAGMLNKVVKGSYIHTANQGNFQFGERAMREIFTNFEKEEAYKLSAEDKVKAIVKALQDARLGYIAHQIEIA
jgi:hypothetical protein